MAIYDGSIQKLQIDIGAVPTDIGYVKVTDRSISHTYANTTTKDSGIWEEHSGTSFLRNGNISISGLYSNDTGFLALVAIAEHASDISETFYFEEGNGDTITVDCVVSNFSTNGTFGPEHVTFSCDLQMSSAAVRA